MSVVNVRIEFAKSLADLRTHAQNFADSVRTLAKAGIDGVLEQLGIPAIAEVEVGEFLAKRADEYLRINVNDQCCRYSRQCLERVHSSMIGSPWRPLDKDTLGSWLRGQSPGHDEVPRLAQFSAQLCDLVIRITPEVLLGEAQLEDVLSRLRLEETVDDELAAKLGSVLRELLAHGISIGNAQGILQAVRAGEDTEALISTLRKPVVEIHVAAPYLHEMSAIDEGDSSGFPNLRDGLFYELGLRFPDAHFVPREDLPPRTFAFRINDLLGAPWVGIAADELAVNVSPTTFRGVPLHEHVGAIVNPGNFNAIVVMTKMQLSEFAADSTTTWGPFEFLVLCMSRELRWASNRFVTLDTVTFELDRLEQGFPALVAATRSRWRDVQLVPALRRVLQEEISVRSLHQVLMSVIDFSPIVTDPTELIVFDDRLPVIKRPPEADPAALAATIRIALKRYISHKYTRGQSTLPVYLLDPAIEKTLANASAGGVSESQREEILRAVHDELQVDPVPGSWLVVLTTVEVRAAFRALIEKEMPRVAVLAYQELSPDLNIQPISRISLQ